MAKKSLDTDGVGRDTMSVTEPVAPRYPSTCTAYIAPALTAAVMQLVPTFESAVQSSLKAICVTHEHTKQSKTEDGGEGDRYNVRHKSENLKHVITACFKMHSDKVTHRQQVSEDTGGGRSA